MTKTAESLFLADLERNPQPSPYRDLIEAARTSGAEYWQIWDLLAFRPKAAYHLARFSQEIMHQEAPIPPSLRELIAAYTSSLNNCEFCMRAHAAVAAQLLHNEELVWSVLRDLENSSLSEKDKMLLRFTRKVTLDSSAITRDDINALHVQGWDDSSIYYAIAACALFNFYNRFVSSTRVPLVSKDTFQRLASRIAEQGYARD
jgi:uncharacterized peroxidase-related enzyme